MNRPFKQILFTLLLIPGLATMASTAHASCDNIDTNPTWNQKLKEVQTAYKAGEYQKAIQIAQSMTSICSDSPALNYYIARSYSALNEPTKASFYYERATNKLSDFRVSPEIAKQIWYGRYEAEYPELSQKYVNELKAENLRLSNDKYKTEQSQTISKTVDYTYEKHKASVVLWTGVGFGIVGLGLTGTGIGLIVTQKDKINRKAVTDSEKYDLGYKLTNTDTYLAGIALTGIGGAFALLGTLMAGIGGYQYNHIKMNETTALSFDVSPNSLGMQLTF